MHEKEISQFGYALQAAKDEFYIDAINELQSLIKNYPESELVDDAYYNIGLCYFNMNQFEKAISYFEKVINEFPNATISILDGGNEFGKTAAKCEYALMNCYLGMSKIEKAESRLKALEPYAESYVILDNGNKLTCRQLAEKALKLYQDK